MTMGVWEALELLNEVVDDSGMLGAAAPAARCDRLRTDPDTALPQIEHLLQTAEAIREAYPEVPHVGQRLHPPQFEHRRSGFT